MPGLGRSGDSYGTRTSEEQIRPGADTELAELRRVTLKGPVLDSCGGEYY